MFVFSNYLQHFQKLPSTRNREIDQECFPFRLKQMIEQNYELPQTYTHRIHSCTVQHASLQEYFTYALEVILFSVTEGELFLVKLSMYVCMYFMDYSINYKSTLHTICKLQQTHIRTIT